MSAAHLDLLHRLLTKSGGRIVVGGEVRAEQRYVAPTFIARPDDDAPVMREEVFGPILPVVPFDDASEAQRRIAALPSPLALYLFSADEKAAMDFAESLPAGAISLNTTMHHFVSSELPFGGVGESGLGRYHGRYGFDTFSHEQAVFSKRTRPDFVGWRLPAWILRSPDGRKGGLFGDRAPSLPASAVRLTSTLLALWLRGRERRRN